MSVLIVRLGDEGSHGDVVVTSAAHSWAEDILIARVGDIYDCPIHGPNPIVEGSATHIVEDALCAFDGCLTACGATIAASCKHSWTPAG
jgi:uncharacterized Zn-binding protein involved in type VI secretion